ncbi:MAG: hypothetical protein ACI9TH_001005 [Kiritimatiellia bacterium]|jgi:hypothetical protein
MSLMKVKPLKLCILNLLPGLLLLAGCGKQAPEVSETPEPVAPLTWPSLARTHFLVKEMVATPDTGIEIAWPYLVEETRTLVIVPDGVMNPLGVKSGLELVSRVLDTKPSRAELATYKESLRSLVTASGLVLDTEDGHVCAAHGGGGANEEGPHHGLMAPFHGKSIHGWVELKLHADGVIECWLAEDPKLQLAYDLPTDTTLTLEYIVAGTSLTFAVRDAETNKSDDGLSNLRDGKTNYFRAGGGKVGNVVVSFKVADETLKTDFINLLPGHE